MKVQGGSGDHWGNRAFDRSRKSLGFFEPESEQKHLAGFKNRADSHGDHVVGHLLALREEWGVVGPCAGGQGFDARTGGEGRGGLVEANVTIAANA